MPLGSPSRIAQAVLIAFGIAASGLWRADAESAARQTPEGTEEAVGDSRCETYCSTVKPGTSVAEIRFSVAPQRLSAPELAARVPQQAIEVTVYAEGFDRGLFARLGSVAPGSAFGPAPAAGTTAPSMPGLGKLVVTDVATSQDPRPSAGLRLMRAAPRADEAELVVVRVEGVEAGMNYYWRVPAPPGGEPRLVTCQAPTCPVDAKARPRPARTPR